MSFPAQDFLASAVDSGLSKWTVLHSCIQSLATAGVMAGAGFVLARRGLLTPTNSKGLAKISMNLTIPCLLFSTVVDCPQNGSSEPCPQIKTNIQNGWPLLLLPIMNVCCGLLLGWINTCIFHPPENFRRAAIAAVAFGNSTGMPITLLAVIYTTLGSKSDIGMVNPVMYLSIYLLMYPLLTWSVGGMLMGINEQQDEEPLLTAYQSLPEAPDHPLLESADRSHKLKCSKLTTTAASTLRKACEATFQPPVIAAIIGMVVAMSPLHPVFVDMVDRKGDCAPLQFLSDGLMRLGQAAVPINMLILGSSLSKGADWETLPLKLNLSIALSKLLLMPLVGLGTAATLKHVLHLDGADASFFLVIMMVTATPTANNLMVMAELGSQDKRALATCIFTQYMLAPFFLTATTWLAITEAVSPA